MLLSKLITATLQSKIIIAYACVNKPLMKGCSVNCDYVIFGA